MTTQARAAMAQPTRRGLLLQARISQEALAPRTHPPRSPTTYTDGR